MSNQLSPAACMAAAICTTIRPDRDGDGNRPCSVHCILCKKAAAAVLRVVIDRLPEEMFHSSEGFKGVTVWTTDIVQVDDLIETINELEGNA